MNTAEASQPKSKIETLEQAEKRHVQEALRATLGNMTEAAKLLGIDRRTLYRMIERHGI